MTERDATFRESQLSAPGTQPAPLTADSATPSVMPSPTSAGAMLRQLRESAGVDPALLASAMKVSTQKLEALETDRFDLLPDVTFARALASAICRAFGTDPTPVLERMPVSAPGLRAAQRPINQPFRRAGDGPVPILAASLSKPLLIAVAALLLGAAALWFLPTLPIQLGAPESAATPGSDGTVRESVGSAVEPAPPAEMPAGAASAEQVAPAPVIPAPPASAAVAAATPADLLSFTASAETWVTVRDAAGKQLINRTLASGETVSMGGELPLSVTVGRKDAVTVTVRGQPFDHKSLSKTTVARFQVK